MEKYADIRKPVWNNLDIKVKDTIQGSWKDATFNKIILEEGIGDITDKLYIGRIVYAVDFPIVSSQKHNNIVVFASVDNFEIIGYGVID